MTIPDSIPFSSIDFGERGRTEYSGIENLADSITQVGLIQPIVVEAYRWPELPHQTYDQRYLLRAGGRRYTALKSLGTQSLFHGSTSAPGRPGFLLANVDSDILRGLLIEIAENHDREDIDWRDDLRMIVKAYRQFQRTETAEANNYSEAFISSLRRQFGAMTKMAAADLKHGLAVHDELVAHPEWFADVGSIRGAYAILCKKNADHVAAIAAKMSYARVPLKTAETQPAQAPVVGQPDPSPHFTIPLSKSLHFGNGLDFMRSLPDASVDHVITDPDYGVSIDRLNSNAQSAADGVVQDTIHDTLRELEEFLTDAFRVTRSFCVFFYDLDHHEKLQRIAEGVGFRVQRWPLVWHKSESLSNAAPSHNFPKNIEYAMVLRKPAATLAQVQRSSVFSCPAGDVVRRFGHPFAKPLDLWRWIYSAVAIKGQTVLDPFAGKGTAPCAAIQSELRPIACEIQDIHFNDLTLNMQGYYRELLGTNITFT